MSERPLGAIVQDITGSFRDIIRLEIRLAVSELRQSAVNVRAGMVLIVVGSVAVVYGVGVLLLSAVYGLSLILAPWLAALTVGVALGAIGGTALVLGTRRWSDVRLPRKTIASVQEVVNELRHESDRA